MDAFSEASIHTVVVMSSAQVGKTEILNNVSGFHVDLDPAPMLILQPTLEMAETWSKDRLSPMLRDTPTLQGKVSDARSRDGNNTIRHKVYEGGHITMAGANSPASLASRPIRVVLCDEIDRYPPSAGAEGDPISLARKRSTTFWNRKLGLFSTPTVKGVSRIEAAFGESDQRRFWVPCPHCGEKQTLKWAQVKWDSGAPESAAYACESCGTLWSDAERWSAVRKGEWRAGASFTGIAGFHLSEIYSPWVRLAETVRSFLEAKPHPERLKTWVNTALGETWEERGEEVDQHVLTGRLEEWDPQAVPAEVLMITCGVDVQGDRLEIERVGWGLEDESWSLEHEVLRGDPSAPDLWRELDEYLLTPTKTKDGRLLSVSAACVDYGGHYGQAVADFVRDKQSRRRVYAIKGQGGPGKPLWPKLASKNNKGRISLFMIGVDAGKDIIYGRLRIAEPGPGYCHFPKDRDPAWFEQLTSEVVVTRHSKGFPVREWQPKPNTRQEALDCRVYAFAALRSMSINWGRVRRMMDDAQRPAKAPAPAPLEQVFDAPAASAPSPLMRPQRRAVSRSSFLR